MRVIKQNFEIANMEGISHIQVEYTSVWVLFGGEISLSYNDKIDVKVLENHMIILPAYQPLYVRCNSPATILINKLDINECFSPKQVSELAKIEDNKKIESLAMHENIKNLFLIQYSILNSCGDEACNHILRAVCVLLNEYYTKTDIRSFMGSVLNEDALFTSFIMQNCLNVNSLNELATKANYSTSGFVKKFHRVFGIAPSVWILSFKAKRILHEILNTNLHFMEIADKYGFNSSSYFYIFCKKHYGKSPSSLRSEVKKIKHV